MGEGLDGLGAAALLLLSVDGVGVGVGVESFLAAGSDLAALSLSALAELL